MTPVEKTAIATAVPVVALISPGHATAMALGLLGGWLARAGVSVRERKPWEEIKREGMVALLASIGSIIVTLYLARLTEADELGIASIGFAVTFGGTDALKVFDRFVWKPIVGAIRNDGDGK